MLNTNTQIIYMLPSIPYLPIPTTNLAIETQPSGINSLCNYVVNEVFLRLRNSNSERGNETTNK